MSLQNKSTFTAQSATRVDLAGGTLDLWPLSVLVKEAATLNSSIDCYTKASFSINKKMTVQVKSPDFSEEFEFDSVKSFLAKADNKLSLLQAAFSSLDHPEKALGEWKLVSESPAGSGLGGSSSLLISILKVMEMIEEKASSEERLVEKARNIETKVLKTPAGIQDYFSPVKKGLNFISYESTGFKRELMSEAFDFLNPQITIVDSQIKHHSGMNNWDILKKFIDGDEKVMGALTEIAQITHDLKSALNSKNIDQVVTCFDRELEARKNVSESYINSDLKSFLNKLKKHSSVKALKVCGAGGGGCVLLLHKPEDKESLRSDLEKDGVSVLPFSLVNA